ncbi:MAG TPA: hypothetical protein VKH45_02050 [Candidatus Acidoferrum sp.]|nr:hypothetical protein [Candidatus Acidoferrum sp.]
MRNQPGCRLPLLVILLLARLSWASTPLDRQPLSEALRWVEATPETLAEYDYIMTVRLHLLFFWTSKDDVGSGYIRRGVSQKDVHLEFFQVLFGSDPDKAHSVNRWGAGTEVAWHTSPVTPQSTEGDVVSSAFFGFMKSSRGKSVSEMQAELKKESEQGEHSFTGILSRVEPTRAMSIVVPMQSVTDYNLHQYAVAEPVMFQRIRVSEEPVKTLQAPTRCPSGSGFMATVAELMDAAIKGQKEMVSRCYVHNSQENTLTLEKISPVTNFPVQLHGPNSTTLLDTDYHDLLQLDFVTTHKETGKKVYFTIFIGTQGKERGVPLQIRYQPNWWFQVVLNLRPAQSTQPMS